jgi:hypothetical protein
LSRRNLLPCPYPFAISFVKGELMILSCSRRCDIPSFFPRWLVSRLEAGYVLVRNPYDRHKVSRISLQPEVVDAMIFWSKNPQPLFPYLDRIPYPYYFQFTLTPYGKELEPNLPDKKSYLVPAFKNLVELLEHDRWGQGRSRVLWRWDPIILTDKMDENFHLEQFEIYCQLLEGYTGRCTISILDAYTRTKKNLRGLPVQYRSPKDLSQLAVSMVDIGKEHGIDVVSCCEDELGIRKGACIDAALLDGLFSLGLTVQKDKGQRPGCRCCNSIDIGSYDCCLWGCRYCYATGSLAAAQQNVSLHDEKSPLLYGNIDKADIITERKMCSLVSGLPSLKTRNVTTAVLRKQRDASAPSLHPSIRGKPQGIS